MANVTPHRMITVMTSDITTQKSLHDIDALADDLWPIEDIVSAFTIRVVDMRASGSISGDAYLNVYWYDTSNTIETNPRIHLKCAAGETMEFGPFFPPHCQGNLLAIKYLNPAAPYSAVLGSDEYIFVEIIYQETE